MSETRLPFEKASRRIIVKRKAETDSKFGCRPKERPVEELIKYGVVNLNKPKGPTSHQISDYLKRILGLKKAGHSGTLDPNVTGVLPVALGRATRIVQNLLIAGKEYVCIMHLHKKVDEDKLKETLKEFTGRIKQLPPLKSAVKRKKRFRSVYYIDILEIEGQDVLFRVGCQAGTYIRKLCHDIGQTLGVGAHMSELVRTKAGPFNDNSMVTLQDVADALHYFKEEGKEEFIRKCVKPIESAVEHLPKIWVLDSTVSSLCHGVNLKVPGVSKFESGIGKNDIVALMTLKDELIAVGKARMGSEDLKKKERGVAAKTDKVFMESYVYPDIRDS